MTAYYLEEYFVAFDHAQFATRTFLNSFGSLLKITHLCIQHRIARLCLLVNSFLRLDLPVEIPHFQPAAFA